MTEPYGLDPRNRHQHSEQGHAAQQPPKQRVGVGSMNRGGSRIWKHSHLQAQGKITAACGSMDFIVFLLPRIPS
jgi:hypothetical protein